MYYVNPNIQKVVRVFDQNSRSEFLRLDLNENPGGLPSNIINDVLNSISVQDVSQYPETAGFVHLLADTLGVEDDMVCLVNGSSEGVRYIIEGFSSVGGRIVCVNPSYFMFQIYSAMYDRDFVKVEYDDNLQMNVENIIAALTDDTQLLILLNPNNPMGNSYTEDEFLRMLDVAKKKGITILIDEAYQDFCPRSFIRYAVDNENILVTRTFSKFFSMAGCRLGYVVGRRQGVEIVQKLCTPHNTNVFALRLAGYLLQNPRIIEELKNKFYEGRHYLINQLDNLGYKHLGDYGNFIFIKPHTSAVDIVKRMKEEKGILIKSYSGIGKMGACLRVTIGEEYYMRKFISALIELDK